MKEKSQNPRLTPGQAKVMMDSKNLKVEITKSPSDRPAGKVRQNHNSNLDIYWPAGICQKKVKDNEAEIAKSGSLH